MVPRLPTAGILVPPTWGQPHNPNLRSITGDSDMRTTAMPLLKSFAFWQDSSKFCGAMWLLCPSWISRTQQERRMQKMKSCWLGTQDRWQSTGTHHTSISRTHRGLEVALTLILSPVEAHFQNPQAGIQLRVPSTPPLAILSWRWCVSPIGSWS